MAIHILSKRSLSGDQPNLCLLTANSKYFQEGICHENIFIVASRI